MRRKNKNELAYQRDLSEGILQDHQGKYVVYHEERPLIFASNKEKLIECVCNDYSELEGYIVKKVGHEGIVISQGQDYAKRSLEFSEFFSNLSTITSDNRFVSGICLEQSCVPELTALEFSLLLVFGEE
jgi:hypothetical protein